MSERKLLIPEYSARDLLAANVARLMQENPELGSPRLLAKSCYWPAHSSKAGLRVSERFIRYVLNPTSKGAHSPSLDVVAAIAAAFKTDAWRLLVDDRQIYLYMLGKTFSGREAVPDAHVEKHIPLPPATAPAKPPKVAAERHRKRRPHARPDDDE